MLPDNTVPYTSTGITVMRGGETFAVAEWH
jgi:ABC-type sulfate transport system substrate-binding protein